MLLQYLKLSAIAVGGGAVIFGSIVCIASWRRQRIIERLVCLAEESPVVGMMLGVAVGDAFGAGVEFQDYEFIQEHVLATTNHFVNVRGQGDPAFGRNFSAGNYTDDTEMTIGLMKAMLSIDQRELKALDEGTLLRFWVAEYHAAQWHSLRAWIWKRLGVGRAGHGMFEAYVQGRMTLDDVRLANSPERKKYPGNAPPMRALPLMFVADDAALLHLAAANADSTHPHPKARAASLLVALAGRHLLQARQPRPAAGGSPQGASTASPPPRDIIARCITSYIELCGASADTETVTYLRAVDALPDYHTPNRPGGGGGGDGGHAGGGLDPVREAICGPQPIAWATQKRGRPVRGLDSDAMRTVGAALYLVKWHRAPYDTLLHAVYMGGDVDSSAAVTLGLVGAGPGLQVGCPGGVPSFALRDLEALEYLVRVAERFDRAFGPRRAAAPAAGRA